MLKNCDNIRETSVFHFLVAYPSYYFVYMCNQNWGYTLSSNRLDHFDIFSWMLMKTLTQYRLQAKWTLWSNGILSCPKHHLSNAFCNQDLNLKYDMSFERNLSIAIICLYWFIISWCLSYTYKTAEFNFCVYSWVAWEYQMEFNYFVAAYPHEFDLSEYLEIWTCKQTW